MHIRSCTIDDYPAVVTLLQNYRPSYTLEALQYDMEHRGPNCKFQQWIAEYNGEILACAYYDQNPQMYHPRKFSIAVIIHPHYDFEDNQIIASTLYEHLIAELQPLDPISVIAMAKDDWRYRYHINLLKTKGFQEALRECWSALDVMAFDFTPYTGIKDKLLTEGIEIKTFQELKTDPSRNHKLHELENELYQDVPFPELATAVDFDYFLENKLNNPNFLSDAYFVAIHNHEYVGLSSLEARPGENYLFTGLTAVKRSLRRKGIALAFKLREISYAKSLGHTAIRTANNASNKAIYTLNEHVGFVPYQIVVYLEKVFR